MELGPPPICATSDLRNSSLGYPTEPLVVHERRFTAPFQSPPDLSVAPHAESRCPRQTGRSARCVEGSKDVGRFDACGVVGIDKGSAHHTIPVDDIGVRH